jgi:hypothetical protein
MIKANIFEDLTEKLSKIMPPELQTLRTDLHQNIKIMLQNYFAELNLVTREEFDLQTAVLAKTRAKLAELEKQLADLEAKI